MLATCSKSRIIKMTPIYYPVGIFVQSQQWKHKTHGVKLYSKLAIQYSVPIVVNFEQISHIVLVFPLLTLNK